MVLAEKVKRAGIYAFYEKDGIVDRYVEYFLNDLVNNLDELVIVSNGFLAEKEKKKLTKYTSRIIERENIGFDIWGFRTGLLEIGWKELINYDEVLLVNNTLMGPVYPFSTMFFEMEKQDVDFWGIARHYELPFDPFGTIEYGYIPEHIQSYFMVFRKSMITAKLFQEYWNNLPELNSYGAAVGKHEASFTKRFSDRGFKWDTYVHTDDLKRLNANPIMNYPMLLIKERKCPVFKRRIFFQDYDIALDATVGQPAYDLFEYLRSSGLYDVDLIWENLLRTCHQSDLAKNMHLSYILPGETGISEWKEKELKKKKVVFVAVLNHLDQLDFQEQYIMAVPKFADLFVLTSSKKSRDYLENRVTSWGFHKAEIRKIEQECIGETSLLNAVQDIIGIYEYVCFYHDSKSKRKVRASIDECRQYKCTSNVLYSEKFVYQILDKFESEPRLGLLVPPESNHNVFFSNIGDEWHLNYHVTEKLIKTLGMDVPIFIEKEPLISGENMFWGRVEALKIILDKHKIGLIKKELSGEVLKEEVPGILRLFAVQAEGYYPAVVMSDVYASNEFDNLRYYVRKYNHTIKRNGLLYGTQRDMVKNMEAVCQGKRVRPGVPLYMRFALSLQKLLPGKLYSFLINIKRRIFGPYDLVR